MRDTLSAKSLIFMLLAAAGCSVSTSNERNAKGNEEYAEATNAEASASISLPGDLVASAPAQGKGGSSGLGLCLDGTGCLGPVPPPAPPSPAPVPGSPKISLMCDGHLSEQLRLRVALDARLSDKDGKEISSLQTETVCLVNRLVITGLPKGAPVSLAVELFSETVSYSGQTDLFTYVDQPLKLPLVLKKNRFAKPDGQAEIDVIFKDDVIDLCELPVIDRSTLLGELIFTRPQVSFPASKKIITNFAKTKHPRGTYVIGHGPEAFKGEGRAPQYKITGYHASSPEAIAWVLRQLPSADREAYRHHLKSLTSGPRPLVHAGIICGAVVAFTATDCSIQPVPTNTRERNMGMCVGVYQDPSSAAFTQ